MTEDKLITELVELTSVAVDDMIAIVDDPSGTPVTKKATVANLATAVVSGVTAGGIGAQPLDAELSALAALPSAADKVPYFTGSGVAALATLTSAARSVLDDTTVAAILATIGGIGASLLTTRGDIIYRNATVPARLAVGASGAYLGSDGTDPVWRSKTAMPVESLLFPATQVPSADANALDDYEEGTWTPTGNGVTFAAASGTYTKIGRFVFFTFDVTWPSTADTGSAYIVGLPFNIGAGGFARLGYTNAGSYPGTIYLFPSGNYLQFFSTPGVAVLNSGYSTFQLTGAGTYSV